MPEGITTAAQQLAEVIDTLPDINDVYPYIHQNTQYYDACLDIVDTFQAETFVPAQGVLWMLVVKLPSITSGGRPKELEEVIARLCSEDPQQGVSGILKTLANDSTLREFGSPRVIDIQINRGHKDDAGTVNTMLAFFITAYVRNS